MNNQDIVKVHVNTTARHLKAGDILVGSGFVVTHDAWAGVRTPKGKVNVEGYYPSNQEIGMNHWNASTTVTVARTP